MTEHNRRSGDENKIAKWLLTILGGVVIVVLAGWLMNTSAEVKSTSTTVAVHTEQLSQLKNDLGEIKTVVKEIRQDQVRRERRENGR